jgi:hypothetical protein
MVRSRSGKGVHDLLGGPVGCGMLGHVKMDDPSAMMSEHEENEDDAQAYQGVDLGVDWRAAAGGPGGSLVQYWRKRRRQTLASATRKSRSVRRSGGRITVRL